jgi:hypothetical protein
MAPIWGFGLAFVRTTSTISILPARPDRTTLAPSRRTRGTGMETLAPSFRSNWETVSIPGGARKAPV